MLEVEGKILYRKLGVVYAEFDYVDALRVLEHVGEQVVSVRRIDDDRVVLGLGVDEYSVKDMGDKVVVRIVDTGIGEEQAELVYLPLAEIVMLGTYYVDVRSKMPEELKKYNFMDMFLLGIIYNLFTRTNDVETTPFWIQVSNYLQKKYPKYVEVAGKLYPLFLEELEKTKNGLSQVFDEAVRDAIRGVSSGLARKNGEHYVIYMLSPSHTIIIKTEDYADILVTLWKTLILPDNSGYMWLKNRRGALPVTDKKQLVVG